MVEGFEDAKLNDLVSRAIAHNHDLRIATANLKEARALRRLTRFDLLPTVQANAGYANSLLSKAAAPPGTPRAAREIEFYDASFDATWELDLFDASAGPCKPPTHNLPRRKPRCWTCS